MIRIRLTYHPPVGSTEESIHIEQGFSVPVFNKLSIEWMGRHTNKLFTTLQVNSAELRKEMK